MTKGQVFHVCCGRKVRIDTVFVIPIPATGVVITPSKHSQFLLQNGFPNLWLWQLLVFYSVSIAGIMKPLNLKVSSLAIHRVKILHAALFYLVLAASTSLAGGQSGSGSGMMGTESSSLFVPSQDISTDGWEQYMTESSYLLFLIWFDKSETRTQRTLIVRWVGLFRWEQYKTESLPSGDLNQCLARCMLHQKQWWEGLHSG